MVVIASISLSSVVGSATKALSPAVNSTKFPVPTVKISSNSELAARKPGWIDFDAGRVLDDGFDATADALLDRICAIASGEETAAERNGEREIAIWKRGVTL